MFPVFKGRHALFLLAATILLSFSGLFGAGSAMAAPPGCKYPFVWREAFDGDYVCVTPDIRSQARADNAQASERVNPDNHDYGPDTCRYGFVWREANPQDHVCVTPDTRARARADNAAAAGRFAAAATHVTPVETRQSYNPAWQAAPGDNRCCPKNMLICPLGRHWC